MIKLLFYLLALLVALVLVNVLLTRQVAREKREQEIARRSRRDRTKPDDPPGRS